MKFVIEHLSKNFEKKNVLRDIDFTFDEGKFTDCSAETVRAKQRCSIA